ncbi:hypothetical protein EBT31_11405 [bacterium]|nr:hypothetical protein [bacterium]
MTETFLLPSWYWLGPDGSSESKDPIEQMERAARALPENVRPAKFEFAIDQVTFLLRSVGKFGVDTYNIAGQTLLIVPNADFDEEEATAIRDLLDALVVCGWKALTGRDPLYCKIELQVTAYTAEPPSLEDLYTFYCFDELMHGLPPS